MPEQEDSAVISQQLAYDKTRVDLAVEASLHIGMTILLAAACILIARPFIPLVTWGIIIAVAAYPSFKKLRQVLGGRGALSSTLFAVVLLAVLIVPVILLAGTMVEGIQALVARFKEGTLVIPSPPAGVENWPVIGKPLSDLWGRASQDLTSAVKTFAPQIKSMIPGLFSASAAIGLTVLQFALSIILAAVLLGNAQKAYEVTCALTRRLFGEKGPELQELMGATIRSVTTGILGVAVIQTVLAGVGFLVAGMPGAGLWAVIFLIAAILQVGALVLIPAIIYMFAISTVTKAAIFLVWCIIVALLDNVLKPILLGRGVAVPIIVIFLGAIGGFLAIGILGLFIGAIVLSVGYKLFLAWLDRPATAGQET